MPRVSIVIRTKNEEQYLQQTLNMIFAQKFQDFEVIIIDSGSTDKTLEIAEKYNVRIKKIRPREFSYGYALNLGAEMSKAKYIVNLSAHAIPANVEWLNHLLAGFDIAASSGFEIGGVYGRQLPLPDANPLVIRDCQACYGEQRKIQINDYFFSNVNAMILRALWEKVPFDESLPYCEDWAWAKQVQSLGYAIVYEPRAAVYHSHNESLRQVFNRSRKEAMGRKMVNPENRMGLMGMIRGWANEVIRDVRYLAISRPAADLRFIGYAPVYRFARQLGFYIGYKRGPSKKRHA